MNARISIQAYKAAKQVAEPFTVRWQEYERRKNQWLNSHPEATHQQYEAAMREIAERCGV